MAYQSKHTGAAIDAAIDAVVAKEKQWDDKQDKLTGNAGQLVIFDENGNPIAQDMPDIDIDTDNLVTLEGGGEIDMAELLGEGPYVISFTSEEEGEVAASLITYDNADSALLATNVQDAIDEIAMNAGDMVASVYDPQGKVTDIFKYVDDATANIDPDVTADEVTFADGETFQEKYDKGELTGPAGADGPQGAPGPAGADGAPATINGVNALTIEAGDGIEMEQDGGTLTLSATAQGSGVSVYIGYLLPGTNWTEDSSTGVKSQSVAIAGVLASHTAIVDHMKIDETYEDFVDRENEYLTYITNGYAETYDGGITFYIFGDANTRIIPIIVEVV